MSERDRRRVRELIRGVWTRYGEKVCLDCLRWALPVDFTLTYHTCMSRLQGRLLVDSMETLLSARSALAHSAIFMKIEVRGCFFSSTATPI